MSEPEAKVDMLPSVRVCVNRKLPVELLTILLNFIPKSAYFLSRQEPQGLLLLRMDNYWQTRFICRTWRTLVDQTTKLILSYEGQKVEPEIDGSIEPAKWILFRRNSPLACLTGFEPEDVSDSLLSSVCSVNVRLSYGRSMSTMSFVPQFMDRLVSAIVPSDTLLVNATIEITDEISAVQCIDDVTAQPFMELAYPSMVLNQLSFACFGHDELYFANVSGILRYFLLGNSCLRVLKDVNLFLLHRALAGLPASWRCDSLAELTITALPPDDENVADASYMNMLSCVLPRFRKLRTLKLFEVRIPLNYSAVGQLQALQELEIRFNCWTPVNSTIKRSIFAIDSQSIKSVTIDTAVYNSYLGGTAEDLEAFVRLFGTVDRLRFVGFSSAVCGALVAAGATGTFFANLKCVDFTVFRERFAEDFCRLLQTLAARASHLHTMNLAYRAGDRSFCSEQHSATFLSSIPRSVRTMSLEYFLGPPPINPNNANNVVLLLDAFKKWFRSTLLALASTSLDTFVSVDMVNSSRVTEELYWYFTNTPLLTLKQAGITCCENVVTTASEFETTFKFALLRSDSRKCHATFKFSPS